MALSKNHSIGKNILNDLMKHDSKFKDKLTINASELAAKSRMEPLITPRGSPRRTPRSMLKTRHSAKNIVPKDYNNNSTSSDEEDNNNNNNSSNKKKKKKLPLTPMTVTVTNATNATIRNNNNGNEMARNDIIDEMKADSVNVKRMGNGLLESPDKRQKLEHEIVRIELTEKILNKLGKNLVWWMASIISRANEPHLFSCFIIIYLLFVFFCFRDYPCTIIMWLGGFCQYFAINRSEFGSDPVPSIA